MARWALRQKHYIAIKDTEWEHKETDRDTGKQVRKVYTVPRFLNPEDPNDYTHKELQAVIVCHEGKGDRRDLVFYGDPTPDMEPLDDEAQAISDSVSKNWVQPMSEQAMPSTGYAGAREQEFMKEIASIMAGQKPGSAVPVPPGADVEELKKQIAALTEQVAALTNPPSGEAPKGGEAGRRR